MTITPVPHEPHPGRYAVVEVDDEKVEYSPDGVVVEHNPNGEDASADRPWLMLTSAYPDEETPAYAWPDLLDTSNPIRVFHLIEHDQDAVGHVPEPPDRSWVAVSRYDRDLDFTWWYLLYRVDDRPANKTWRDDFDPDDIAEMSAEQLAAYERRRWHTTACIAESSGWFDSDSGLHWGELIRPHEIDDKQITLTVYTLVPVA